VVVGCQNHLSKNFQAISFTACLRFPLMDLEYLSVFGINKKGSAREAFPLPELLFVFPLVND
jgi:hypothetical protein